MAELRTDQRSTTQYVILDTCIMQYLDDTNFGDQVLEYLLELKARGFDFAISDITYYESICSAAAKQEEKITQALKLFQTFSLDSNLLLAAGQLYTLYAKEHLPYQKVSDGDVIIATTSIMTGSLILTANCNDFPSPFFKEGERKKITYSKKKQDKLMVFLLLEPDFEVINHRFSNRD